MDYGRCVASQLCVEVCPFDAIKMDQIFELSTQDRFAALLLNKTQLAKPNDYFNKLHKTEAGEIDVRREDDKKKAEAAAAAKAAAAAPKPAPAAAPPTPGGTQ